MTAGGSSIPEVRRLLTCLAATKPAGRLAEIGTAYGLGARALLDGLGPAASLVSVEPDTERWSQACRTLAGTPAEILNARWEDVLPQRGPFDLIFFDGGTRRETLGLAVDLLAPGGILIKDDLTPGGAVLGDPVREAFLTDPRLCGVEMTLTAEMSVIIATRLAAA